jgi:hypothetical protein
MQKTDPCAAFGWSFRKVTVAVRLVICRSGCAIQENFLLYYQSLVGATLKLQCERGWNQHKYHYKPLNYIANLGLYKI